jgi:hypothetical protein
VDDVHTKQHIASTTTAGLNCCMPSYGVGPTPVDGLVSDSSPRMQ